MDSAALHDLLRQRAFLHDDPEAYLAGVDDALAVLSEGEHAEEQSQESA